MSPLSRSTSIGLIAVLLFIFVIHIGFEFELGKEPLDETIFKAENDDTTENESKQQLEVIQPTKEKYISYLPHSGLHNQRIALINSILLAKALNRTLIVPEVNLGTATYWRPSSILPKRLDACGEEYYEENDQTRRLKEKDRAYWKAMCFDYRNYLPMEVNRIFDIMSIAEALDIKIIQRRDMKLDYYERYWSIPQDESNQTLVYQVDDPDRYAYQIVDTLNTNNKKKFTKYTTQYTFQQLNQIEQPFLLFNSLFGSTRLILNDPSWQSIQQQIREGMIVHHPWVLKASDIVMNRLGGQGNYMSVHLRMGDGIFKKIMEETMEKVRQQLIQRQQIEEEKEKTTFELDPAILQQAISLKNNHRHSHLHHQNNNKNNKNQTEERLKFCLHLQQLNYPHHLHHRFSLIYMTTDASSPHETLSHLYDEFLCLFALDDFQDIIQDTLNLSPPLIDHHHQNDPVIHTTKGSVFLPLIDAEIASRASFFVPTLQSTFSAYITQRNRSIQKQLSKSTTTTAMTTNTTLSSSF
ncbi:unnamed protein product [Cunninghamella echinulata]